MAKKDYKDNNGIQPPRLEISDKQVEILARRLLPEIKRYFANEKIRREFEAWERKQQDGNTQ